MQWVLLQINRETEQNIETRTQTHYCCKCDLLVYTTLCDITYVWCALSLSQHFYSIFSPADVFNKWKAAERFYFTHSYRLAISEQWVTLMAFNFCISHNSFPRISISRVVCWQRGSGRHCRGWCGSELECCGMLRGTVGGRDGVGRQVHKPYQLSIEALWATHTHSFNFFL